MVEDILKEYLLESGYWESHPNFYRMLGLLRGVTPNLGVKEYSYHGGRTFYYVTINGKQVGSVHFNMKTVYESYRKIIRGQIDDGI